MGGPVGGLDLIRRVTHPRPSHYTVPYDQVRTVRSTTCDDGLDSAS